MEEISESVCGKLTFVNLKQLHSENQERLNSLAVQ